MSTKTIIEVPGGTATLRDPGALPERGRRLIRTSIVPLASVFAKIPRSLFLAAREDTPEGKEARAEAERAMSAAISTRQEANAFLELRDAVVIALLESWDLERPLPTIDTIQDLEPDLYDALEKATRELTPATMAAGTPTNFEPQPLDRDSPFGEFVTSEPGSRAAEKGSKRKRLITGASTSSARSSA